MLQAIALSKNFGGLRAVDGVSFSLAPGCLAGLIGPNGAGKTTLFNLLAGSLKPSAGQLLFAGRPIAGLPPHAVFAAGIARTFQIPRPFAAMTVLENMMVAPRRQSGERFWRNWLSPAAIAGEERLLRDKALGLLAFLGLEGLAGAPARILSGGQRKLLELGRVLMADPKLILLDEPGAGVNPTLLAVIIDKIAALNRSGIGFLIIEHNMDLVMNLCRPILVMANGALLLEGSAATVRADPRVLAAYLGGAAA
jgi:branched-chain amino acid transport system ATP-binding protein